MGLAAKRQIKTLNSSHLHVTWSVVQRVCTLSPWGQVFVTFFFVLFCLIAAFAIGTCHSSHHNVSLRAINLSALYTSSEHRVNSSAAYYLQQLSDYDCFCAFHSPLIGF